MTKVFISYRREDSAAYAGRIHDRLEREFGRDLLFMDVDAIPLGVDFVEVLSEEVSKCDLLLAVIGQDWFDVRDDEGNRRLDDENDFVRIEIATALRRDIPVVPLLVDGAPVPKSTQLPVDIRSLSRRNGMSIRHASFHADMDRLINWVRRYRDTTPTPVKSASDNTTYSEILSAFQDYIANRPNHYIIVEDANGAFVQFIDVREDTVLLDLPCINLSQEQIEEAKRLLGPHDITLQNNPITTFQGRVAANPSKLADLTMHIFKQVYGGHPRRPLKFIVEI